jgi:2-polyprenyl-3-methyl-5-hydroxy-6-metoxy-1,4-benzoquinol methylase
LLKSLNSLAHRLGRHYVKKICANEFLNQPHLSGNERPIEYRFALQALAPHHGIEVLDVGTGLTAWPHLLRTCGYTVTAIDNVKNYWPDGMVNRHWEVLDIDIAHPNLPEFGKQYDAITCISVLEHIEEHKRAVLNMVRLLKSGGLLVLTTPFSYSNPHPNVYIRPDAIWGKDLPYICRSSSSIELEQWLSCGLTLEKKELWRLFTGPVWATGGRCEWEEAKTERQAHHLGCFLFHKN